MRHPLLAATLAALLAAPVAASAGTHRLPAASSGSTTSEAIAPEPTPLGCPEAPLVLSSGLYAITQTPCSLAGGITLEGDATLLVSGIDFVVDGSIVLRGDAALRISGSVFTIANHFVQEHRIDAHDRATLELTASVLRTNAGTVTTSLSTQYAGHDDSRLVITDSFIEPQRSWLLAAFYDRSALRTVRSTFLPTETYPHDFSTIEIEGGDSHGVWLEFLPGSQAVLEDIPSREAPFDFEFGRDTPGVVGVGWQVSVTNGIAGFVIASFPLSDVTVKDNLGPVVIGYFFQDVAEAQSLVVTPSMRDATLTHQGRILRLENATLEGFGWQLYAGNSSAVTPEPVQVADSVVNEIGALDGAAFEVRSSLIEFAVVAAVGQDSSIAIDRSTLYAHGLLAEKNGRLEIEGSELFGALVQARDDARIVLLNTTLGRNVCHPGCPIPCVAPDGGCNPYNDANVETRFQVDGNGEIVALGLDPIASQIRAGETIAFTGDVLVERAPEQAASFTYDLRYRRIGASASGEVTIAASVPGPLRSATLGTLDTTGLATGRYVATLQLSTAGAPVATVERRFTVVRTGPIPAAPTTAKALRIE